MRNTRDGNLVEIGHGILEARGSGKEIGQSLEAPGFFRFLDYLYLPVPLEELTIEQVLVINRYRERYIKKRTINSITGEKLER